MSGPVVTQALSPCPFCGGEADRYTIGPEEPNNAGGDVIVCTRCSASSHVEFGRKENLVSRWNSRLATEAASAERVRVLEETLGKIIAKLDSRDGQAPGHHHRIKGVWDEDNGERAGKPCEWCAEWSAARALLSRAKPTDGQGEAA